MKGSSLTQMSMKGRYIKAMYNDEPATPINITLQGNANGVSHKKKHFPKSSFSRYQKLGEEIFWLQRDVVREKEGFLKLSFSLRVVHV